MNGVKMYVVEKWELIKYISSLRNGIESTLDGVWKLEQNIYGTS